MGFPSIERRPVQFPIFRLPTEGESNTYRTFLRKYPLADARGGILNTEDLDFRVIDGGVRVVLAGPGMIVSASQIESLRSGGMGTAIVAPMENGGREMFFWDTNIADILVNGVAVRRENQNRYEDIVYPRDTAVFVDRDHTQLPDWHAQTMPGAKITAFLFASSSVNFNPGHTKDQLMYMVEPKRTG